MLAAFTGLWMGMNHVWTGPDHLAAIAPLAADRPRRAWIPGIRWGLGHSAGVAVVGLLALWFRDRLPLEWISSWGERIVGVMLLAVGLWGIRKALKYKIHTHEHEHDGERHLHIHVHGRHADHGHVLAHQHTHAAFGIGILHGLAGSSHFLGVLPTLTLPTTGQAIAYLAAFGVGTVFSMAVFSWFMGFVTMRCASGSVTAYRRVMGLCSAAAVVIGCFWLASAH